MLKKFLLSCLFIIGCTVPDTMGITEPNLSVAKADNHTYIVQLNVPENAVRKTSVDMADKFNGKLSHVYVASIKGFAIELPDNAVQALAKSPMVSKIEMDGMAYTNQSTSIWGIDRIDQRTLPLNSTYNYNADGTGVQVYILDTGINPNHTEFTGRMGAGFSALGDGITTDCHGHGTHVAGTAAGRTVGVARNATIIPVRVLGCDARGSWSGIIAGIDFVAQQKRNNPNTPMVANMSIGGGISTSVNDAVTRASQAGVVFAVSAGNSNTDACSQTPASTPVAITVGSTGTSDSRSSFSNFGKCVDIFAPGEGITSAYYTSTTGYVAFSGTSMSSPHVAGVAALVLQQHPTYNVAQVTDAMLDSATINVLTNVGIDSPNTLLYSFVGTSDYVPPPPPVENIILNVSKQVNRKKRNAVIQWSGALGTNVTIFKNNVVLVTTANDGSHTDAAVSIGIPYSYKVCNITCSNIVTVQF